MALIATWLSDSIRRFRQVTNPSKFPATLNFDATVSSNPWGDGSGFKQFAMGEFIIHQIVMEFDDDMFDQYILFQPAMYEEPGAVPSCLWEIHIPDALDVIWATPPVILTEANGFVVYLGTELSAKNIDLNVTINTTAPGTRSVTIQYTTVVGKYMFGEANDVQEVNNDWLLKPSKYALSDEPTTNGNEALPSTFYAVGKWLFGFYIQVLDTDNTTIITVNGVNTAFFPDAATPTIAQQLLFGKYYNSNNNAIDNPSLINPQFIFEKQLSTGPPATYLQTTCLSLSKDTRFTFKLDFGAYTPKGAVVYLINTVIADDTVLLLENYDLDANAFGYRTVLNTGGTGSIGNYFKAPMTEWSLDSGTVYKLSFMIDCTQLVDILQKYRMVVIAYSTNNDVFNSFISPELSTCCDCTPHVYEMLVRHIDCDHATGTVEVLMDTFYDGVLDELRWCENPPVYSFEWTDGITTYTDDATPNITGLTAGIWTINIYGACSELPLFTYDVEIKVLTVTFDIDLVQPCSAGGTGSITATTDDTIDDWATYDINLEFPDASDHVMVDGVPYTGLAEGIYTVCITAISVRETITINPPPDDPPVFDTPLFDANGECEFCAPAVLISSLEINLTTTKGTCDCGAIATVDPSPDGNYTYLWSNGSTAQTVSGLCPGDYWVKVYNNSGCTKLEKFTITPNDPDYPITLVDEPPFWPVPCDCSDCRTFITNLEKLTSDYLELVLPHMDSFTTLGYNSELFGKADCVDTNFNKTNDFIYLGIYLVLLEMSKADYQKADPDDLLPSNAYLRNSWFIVCIEKYFTCQNINIQQMLALVGAEETDGAVDNYINSQQSKRPYPPYNP